MLKLFSQLLIVSFFLFPTVVFGEGKKFMIHGSIPEMPQGKMVVMTQQVGRVDTLGVGIFMRENLLLKVKLKNRVLR